MGQSSQTSFAYDGAKNQKPKYGKKPNGDEDGNGEMENENALGKNKDNDGEHDK